jgi:hypothetical protein
MTNEDEVTRFIGNLNEVWCVIWNRKIPFFL